MLRNRLGTWLLAATCSMLLATACGGSSTGVGKTGSTGAGPASLAVNNVSAETIFYIYMSPSSDGMWGPDLLGSAVLPIGSSFEITNIGSGYWDIRVEDASGNVKEWFEQYLEPGGIYWVDVDSDGWAAP